MVFDGSDGDDNVNAAGSDGVLSAGAVADTYTSIQNFDHPGLRRQRHDHDRLRARHASTAAVGNDALEDRRRQRPASTSSAASDNVRRPGRLRRRTTRPSSSGLGTATIADTGPAGLGTPGTTDTLTVFDCAGVTVTATQASRGQPRSINYSGIEQRPVRVLCVRAASAAASSATTTAAATTSTSAAASTSTSAATVVVGRRRRALRRPEREGQDRREGESGTESAEVRGRQDQASLQREGQEGPRDRAEQAARARGTRATRRSTSRSARGRGRGRRVARGRTGRGVGREA